MFGFGQKDTPIGAPTPSKPPGRFAGANFANLGKAAKIAAQGFNVLNTGFDVASLANSDNDAREKAREMAVNLIDQGYTDYDSIMALAQSNPGLESAIGDVGVSDYAKTVAGVGMQAGDFLTGGLAGLITAPIGAAAQVNLQHKKSKRNEAFREQFANELIERGLT